MRIIDDKTEDSLNDVLAYADKYDNLYVKTQDPDNGQVVSFCLTLGAGCRIENSQITDWEPMHGTRLFRKGDVVTLEF